MNKQNPIGTCLAEIKRQPRIDPKQATIRGRLLTRRMLDEVVELPESDRSQLRRSLTREEIGFLFGIATGCAIDAIRYRCIDDLRDGLLALIIEAMQEDPRETVRHLCLLHHSAAKLGLDLAEVYEPLRRYASQDMRELIEGWFHEGTKDIGMMGYAEGTLRDGRFTYVSTL